MGRKSREKANRLRKGDIICLDEEVFFSPRGIYLVKSVEGSMISLQVGEITCFHNKNYIGKYKKLSVDYDVIDWKAEEEKYKEHFEMIQNSSNWEDVDYPEDDPEDSFWGETSVRVWNER